MDSAPTPNSTRRAGVETRSVRLADGRSWGLALPTVRIRPRFHGIVEPSGQSAVQTEVVRFFGYAMEVESLIVRLRSAAGGTDTPLVYRGFMKLAARLLQAAHDVTSEQAIRLLDLPEEELPALVAAVLGVVSIRNEPPREAGPRES